MTGSAVTGVGSVPGGLVHVPVEQLKFDVTVLVMDEAPAGNGLFTFTAKVAVPVPPPPTTVPAIASVQAEPTQTHAGSDAAALNVELVGTVSFNTTPVASALPELV